MNAKSITKTALLTAAALVMFVIESHIPNPIPIPGAKLGLANIFVVYALYAIDAKHALCLLFCKVMLGSLLAGHGSGLLYSAAGGGLCFLLMLLAKQLLHGRRLWLCSVVGALGHNAGQLAMAIAVTRTWQVAALTPALLTAGFVTGLFTGLAAQFAYERLEGIRPNHAGGTER